MRIWSLHPDMLLESNNYVACWSETLQGAGALLGKHKMHLYHPQLNRFKRLKSNCLVGLYTYLDYFYETSLTKIKVDGKPYSFDQNKINYIFVDRTFRLKVSRKQIIFELDLLNKKRISKGLSPYSENELVVHPIFDIVDDFDDKIEKGERL